MATISLQGIGVSIDDPQGRWIEGEDVTGATLCYNPETKVLKVFLKEIKATAKKASEAVRLFTDKDYNITGTYTSLGHAKVSMDMSAEKALKFQKESVKATMVEALESVWKYISDKFNKSE